MLPAILAALSEGGEVAAGMAAAGQNANQAGISLKSFSGKLNEVASNSSTATEALTSTATALKTFAEPINQLVQLANPAPVELFNLAWRDTLAVVGRALLPITQALTRVMRTLGDDFARFEPLLNSVANVVANVIEEVLDEFQATINESGLELEVFAEALKIMARLAGMAAESVLRVVRSLGRLLGVAGTSGQEKPGASSFGAAVRNIGTTSQGEDISRKAIEKALQAAFNTTGKPTQDDVPNILDGIKTFLEGAWDTLVGILGVFPTVEFVSGFLQGLLDQILSHLPEAPQFLKRGIQAEANNPGLATDAISPLLGLIRRASL